MNSSHPAEEWVGRKSSRRVLITRAMVAQFAELSGDHSPNHVSDEAAQAQGFERLVVHGWLLGSLVSGCLANDLPAAPGVEHDIAMSFRRPCYPGDEITISLEVTEFFESVRTLILKLAVVSSSGATLATGRIQYGLK